MAQYGVNKRRKKAKFPILFDDLDNQEKVKKEIKNEIKKELEKEIKKETGKKYYTGQYGEKKMYLNIAVSPDYRELLEEDYNKIARTPKPLLSAYVDFLSRVANRRLLEFETLTEKTGYDFTLSPAYRATQEDEKLFDKDGKRRFGYKDLSLNELRSMYVKLVKFINAPTGTADKWAQVKLNILEKSVGEISFKDSAKKTLIGNLDRTDKFRTLSVDEEKRLWSIFNKLYEENTKTMYDSDQAIVDITKMIRSPEYSAMSNDEILDIMNEIVQKTYEANQLKEQEAEEDFLDALTNYPEL